MFDSKKNPPNFRANMEKAIDNLPLRDGTPLADDLVKKFGVKNSDELKNLIEHNFNKIFNLIEK